MAPAPTTPIDHTPASDAAGLVPDDETTLATGWEPTLDPGDTLLRCYLATLEDRLGLLARAGEGRIRRDTLATYVDLDSAYVFDNIVLPHGFLTDAELDEVVTEAARFFPDGRVWSLQALSPASAAARRGLVRIGHPPLMYRPSGGAAPVRTDGFDIRPVRTEDELRDFEETLTAAYPLPDGSAVLAPGVLDHGFRGWVGYADGRPVATSGSHSAHGLTEVEWVSCRPSFRGRGFGAAMTWTAATAAPGVPAVLVATDEGRPVYERLGFVALVRLSMWLHP